MGRPQILAGAGRHLDPDLVDEAKRSHRHPEGRRGAIDRFDGRSLAEEMARLVQVGAEDPVHEEAGTVADDHGELPHREREGVGGGDGGSVRLRAADDLDEGHPVDGMEEVHPEETLRAVEAARHLGDGEARGVRREEAPLAHGGLELPEHRLLDRHPFGDGLDHEIQRAEPRVV